MNIIAGDSRSAPINFKLVEKIENFLLEHTNMSAFEVACWEYEINKKNGKFGIEIYGGLDKDPAQNPHSKNG